MCNEQITLNIRRRLHFAKDDKAFDGDVIISDIQAISANKWVCHWSVDHLSGQRKVYGEDALNALTNCLLVIAGLIKGAGKDGVSVWWQYSGDSGGIPHYPPESDEDV